VGQGIMEEPRKQNRGLRDVVVLFIILLGAALIILNTAANLLD
jgi:hypothetical protein